MKQPSPNRTDRGTKLLLGAIALLLGLNLISNGSTPVPGPSEARAQNESRKGGGLISAATQRKQMIEEIRRMNSAIQALDAKINAGLNVRVTDMPEIRLPRDSD
ncbi:MAG: hypothetical protein AAGB51_12745 [Planctomycetota bacterium]